MAKSAVEARATKEAAVDEIRTKLGESEATVLTEYRGLSVTALAELRAALRPTDTEYKVFKNTLARRAVEEVGASDLVQFLEGPTAIAFVKGDIAAAAKAMKEFAKGNDAFVLKGGLLGDKAVTPKEIEALAELPSREVLLSQIAGLFEAPLSQMASLFEGSARNVLYAVNALIEKREQNPNEGGQPQSGDATSGAEPEAAGETAPAPAAEEAAPEAAAEATPEAEAADTEAPAEAPAADETPESE